MLVMTPPSDSAGGVSSTGGISSINGDGGGSIDGACKDLWVFWASVSNATNMDRTIWDEIFIKLSLSSHDVGELGFLCFWGMA